MVDRVFTPSLRAVLLAVGLLLGQPALAGPPGGRMAPEDRDRLRDDLRQHRPDERHSGRGWDSRPGGTRGRDPAPLDWNGRSRSPGAGYPGDAGGFRGERMSPEERRQLRMLLRERSLEGRIRPGD